MFRLVVLLSCIFAVANASYVKCNGSPFPSTCTTKYDLWNCMEYEHCVWLFPGCEVAYNGCALMDTEHDCTAIPGCDWSPARRLLAPILVCVVVVALLGGGIWCWVRRRRRRQRQQLEQQQQQQTNNNTNNRASVQPVVVTALTSNNNKPTTTTVTRSSKDRDVEAAAPAPPCNLKVETTEQEDGTIVKREEWTFADGSKHVTITKTDAPPLPEGDAIVLLAEPSAPYDYDMVDIELNNKV